MLTLLGGLANVTCDGDSLRCNTEESGLEAIDNAGSIGDWVGWLFGDGRATGHPEFSIMN
jgi:hypothetical protein